jgi:hypothetical protein
MPLLGLGGSNEHGTKLGSPKRLRRPWRWPRGRHDFPVRKNTLSIQIIACYGGVIIADYLIVDGISVAHIMGPGKIVRAKVTPGAELLPDGLLVYPAEINHPH